MTPDLFVQRDVQATVREAMLASGVNQSTLGSWLGLSQAAVSRRLTGTVEFTVAELRTVAEHLGTSAEALLGRSTR